MSFSKSDSNRLSPGGSKQPSVRFQNPSASSTCADESSASPPENRSAKYWLVPQRYILFIMAALAVFGCHLLRHQPMVIVHNTMKMENYSCKIPEEVDDRPPNGSFSMNVTWNGARQSLYIATFYWSAAVSLLPAGYLADQYGGKHVVTVGILGSSLCCLLFPLIMTRRAQAKLFLLRFLDGLFQGCLYPALNAVLAHWTPQQNRNTVFCFVYGITILNFLTSKTMGSLFMKLGYEWSFTFYLLGALGMIWCLLWELLCHSRPEYHPCIRTKEAVFLNECLEGHVVRHRKTVPLRSLLNSKPVWALVLAKMAEDWYRILFTYNFGEYQKSALRIHTELHSVWIVVPNMPIWLTVVIFGCVADWLVHERHVHVTLMRRSIVALAIPGNLIFLMFVSTVRCERIYAIVCFTASFFFTGMYFCTLKLNAVELAPNFCGTVSGFVHTVGWITGVPVLLIVRTYSPETQVLEFLWPDFFWMNVVLLLVAGAVFVSFGSGEEQPWNMHQTAEELGELG